MHGEVGRALFRRLLGRVHPVPGASSTLNTFTAGSLALPLGHGAEENAPSSLCHKDFRRFSRRGAGPSACAFKQLPLASLELQLHTARKTAQ